MNKKAIITGGTGFVGSNLCRMLVDNNWKVYIISRKSSSYDNLNDIRDKVTIYEYNYNILDLIYFFNLVKADIVFHIASLYISEHEPKHIDNLIDSNVKFGTHILEAMSKSNTKLIINTGTSWQHYHTNEYNPVNLYASTKEAFEKVIKYYTETENIRCITLKLFDTYGETDKRKKLINLLNKFADEHKQLNMSPGNQVINLVHIDDVINAFIKAYEYLIDNKEIINEVYGVGTENIISLKELMTLFEEVTGKKLNIIWGGHGYRKREVMKLWKGYKKLPNWNCRVTLREGLGRYRK
ncbi:MAG: NAD(P)-dependent oxidoreductase [Vallitalea sp.]|jgi:nucleoside-diphosphate-sugar epimerase|nr:NAD(P)-dependent oxidoreductase [Vallitalea sp.]